MTSRAACELLVLGLLAAAGSAATNPGVALDLQGYLNQALARGERTITIPPGRYRVTPHNREHLVLRDLHDVTLNAGGVELVCTETTRALTISHCRNVTLRGLAIDYDPLPFTQGRLTAVSPDHKVHEIELFDGYPPAAQARNFKYEIFTPDTRVLHTDDHYPEKVEAVDARHLRVTLARGNPRDPAAVGDIIALGTEWAPHGSIPHAVECSGNVNVRLEDVDLWASNCFGFIEVDCDGSQYVRCRIDRRPPAQDPVPRADPRIRSLNADAFHSKQAEKGPQYVGCVARFMGDDAINICGDYHMVTACTGSTLRVLAKGSMNIAADDPVELFAYDGHRLPDAVAQTVERDGQMTAAEQAFVGRQRMDEGLRTRTKVDAFKITLDRAVDLPMGSLIASARRMGNGFRVEGCDFGFNRSRGILIKASDGQVIGNRLTANWGPAILVSPEYWWLESGSSNHVEIRDNVIADCRARAIVVEAFGGAGLISGQPAPSGAHNHIAVVGNRISRCPLPNVFLTSIDGLRLEANTFEAPLAQPGQNVADEVLRMVNCEHVTQGANHGP